MIPASASLAFLFIHHGTPEVESLGRSEAVFLWFRERVAHEVEGVLTEGPEVGGGRPRELRERRVERAALGLRCAKPAEVLGPLHVVSIGGRHIE